MGIDMKIQQFIQDIKYNSINIYSMEDYLQILEYINIAITIFFLLAYIYRLFLLRHFAITEQYKSKYPWPRIILCLLYVVVSIAYLALSIVMSAIYTGENQFWIIQFGVGECVDGIILLIQMVVLWQELNKERPYTPIHLLFSIYLALVSLIRMVFVVIILVDSNQKADVIVFVAFYFVFLVNSVILLGYWVAKRQELPQFQQNSYFNFDELHNLNQTRNIMHRNIQISQLRKTSRTFNYIRPTVSVQKGQFRIILQTLSDEDSQDKVTISQVENRSTRKVSNCRKLKIISNQIYSLAQILQLYKICGRFNIQQKLNFDHSQNLIEMYKNIQVYLDQLFNTKTNYIKSVLKFFNVQQSYMENCDRVLRDTFKQSQMGIYANIDRNASIISINIFKQLWMDDYYLFYMDIVSIDRKFQSQSMKRYNDFQMFHNQLGNIIRKKYGGKYTLPNLPKKFLFNSDEGKITQRRNQLQTYLRSITNDYILMIQLHEVRQATLQFLGFYDAVGLDSSYENFATFYKNIQVVKGSISKQLTNSEYVTFFEFKIIYNGIPVRAFKKRFNQFVILHENIERWMNNTQINYKFLVLPEKHIYKSGEDRHEKLKTYLQLLIKVQQVWKIYEVNAFLQVGSNSMKDISMSRISSKEVQFQSRKMGTIQDEQMIPQKFIDQQSFESKDRMSALIEELGSNY